MSEAELPSVESAAARIRFDHVGKSYRRRQLKSVLLKDVLRGVRTSEDSSDRFWALDDVSFTIRERETVAVLGQNGSGKSTTLSLCAGSSHPTVGRVSVRGRIAPVLALGVGFQPDMTAPENAYVNASLLGVSREELSGRLEQILAFAELGDFVHSPVRHYSTGMTARLGFAVAMHVDADILLIDEVLAVGDGAFQAKCLQRIGTLRAEGRTMMFITHDLLTAQRVCTRGIWMREGKIELDDDIERCVREYRTYLETR
ncbi:MAG: ABC transporter ATP-binding protein [Sandaracinaceae bacterium]